MVQEENISREMIQEAMFDMTPRQLEKLSDYVYKLLSDKRYKCKDWTKKLV